jgi:hydrogenase maturation protein HypF
MMRRRRLTVQGTVQGVGFRPFVYRLAGELRLSGWVVNSSQGVVIEIEGSPPLLDAFIDRLRTELPPHAAIHSLSTQDFDPLGSSTFEIRQSKAAGTKTALILPDLATCPECLHEIFDPADRRYRYPFTNCTHCGPRFSIIESLPYDRINTTMRGFVMCEQCRAEYENPLDRRFHAQPNACPNCGPQITLWDQYGHVLAERDEALKAAAGAIRQGFIVAVKGIGGFHLMADARNAEVVALLRIRKGRYEKPLAVMFPSLKQAKHACRISDKEQALLQSSAAPIVLVRHSGSEIAPSVAPDNPYLGVLLPYTPLHHLLLAEIGFPVIATSGNFSGEPIITDNIQARKKLSRIADMFLVHNRPIAHQVDDSVVCVAAEETLTLRRARGYAPLPVDLPGLPSGKTIIAAGAQQKNTVALLHNGHVFLSQHLGDMDSVAALDAFRKTLADFQKLYEAVPTAVACDLHPDYVTTQYAERLRLPVIRVQHHYAHVLSCMAEHRLSPPLLGIAWDGTGYGPDHTIWGSEFLHINGSGFTRAAHLRAFALPGGDSAAHEPRRSLLGILYTMFGSDLPRDRLQFKASDLNLLLSALRASLNTPLTSSMGRLFDAVAALAGLGQKTTFEGQAAMALEYASHGVKTDEFYPYEITSVTNDSGVDERIIEWKPMIAAIMMETNPAEISAKFHNTLAEIVVAIAQQVGEPTVALTGGCFQNRVLLERCVGKLRAAGFVPCWQQHIPPNDGGIALGQIAAALREGNHVSGSSGQIDQH